MKKIISLLIILFVAGGGIYLNRAYAHIYNVIGEKNLSNPTTETHYLVGENNNKIIKVSFLGDSLTAGNGTDKMQNSYPYLIAKKMTENKNQIKVLNLGIPGAKSIDVINYEIEATKNFNPDQIFLFIGMNDLHNHIPLNDFEKNLSTILENFNKKNITLVTIPYLGEFLPPYQTYFDWQTKKYNEIITKVANDQQTKLIDLYSTTEKQFKNDKTLYSADLFHPNNKGYELIANVIYDNTHF